MDKMHQIQLEIFKNLIEVCQKLELKYFLVHGSLLGAVMNNKFMPLDDDIDIAMPRTDYEKLLEKGNELINKKYFIQANKTDKNYPLDFAKVRDCDTTYVAELFRNIDMNHGMFIDIFPIDFYDQNNFKRRYNSLRLSILSVRISKVYAFDKVSLKSKLLRFAAMVIYPSYHKALRKKEKIFCSVKKGKFIRLTGAKTQENKIPAEWFKETVKINFEGIESCAPKMYHEYLTQIYGDYKNRTLLEDKEHSDDSVEINACVFDPEKAYKHYINRGL